MYSRLKQFSLRSIKQLIYSPIKWGINWSLRNEKLKRYILGRNEIYREIDAEIESIRVENHRKEYLLHQQIDMLIAEQKEIELENVRIKNLSDGYQVEIDKLHCHITELKAKQSDVETVLRASNAETARIKTLSENRQVEIETLKVKKAEVEAALCTTRMEILADKSTLDKLRMENTCCKNEIELSCVEIGKLREEKNNLETEVKRQKEVLVLAENNLKKLQETHNALMRKTRQRQDFADQFWFQGEQLRKSRLLPRLAQEEQNTTYRVEIPRLEIDIVDTCNLKCDACAHFSPHRDKITPSDEIIEWFRTWSQKVTPKEVHILGGEPLLHPELEKILYAAKEHWIGSQIVLVTNGLLLEKTAENVFFALKRISCRVEISMHFPKESFDKITKNGIEKLQNAGIPYNIRNSYSRWTRFYEMNSENHYMPRNDSPSEAYYNCFGYICANLRDNKLYRCSQIQCANSAYIEGLLPDDWKWTLDYRPLTTDVTPEEILLHLTPGAMKECGICPAKLELVQNPKQLTLSELKSESKKAA